MAAATDGGDGGDGGVSAVESDCNGNGGHTDAVKIFRRGSWSPILS